MIVDVSTFPDLDLSGRWIDEDASIIECFRRGITQPAGALEYSPEDGFYLRTLLSRGIDQRLTYAYEDALETQAKRDERVAAATATVTYDVSTETLFALVVLRHSFTTTTRTKRHYRKPKAIW